MDKLKQILTASLLGLMVLVFSLAGLLLPDQESSREERRKLQTLPEFSWSRDYGEDLETYFADQMILRRELRTAKGWFSTKVMGRLDNGGYYQAGNVICKMEYPLDEKQVGYAADRLAGVYEDFLKGTNLRWAVIPDKGYYAGEGRPGLDYERLAERMLESLGDWGEYVDLFEVLSLEDYYATDTHWRQERLFPAAAALLKSFGLEGPDRKHYTAHEIDGFMGAYFGASGLPAKPETLTYLTSPLTEHAVVTSAEEAGTMPLYTLNQWEESLDGYNIFLGGPQAVVTVENPLAEEERELVLFRDSFGSSIAPLLLEGYSKVTLVDLRYIAPELLPQYVDMAAADDVLMLFSVQVLNAGRILK
ncbi:hypothetical protein KQI82_03750 [Oscillibacter sp. MSJ-2]|uniref:AlgX/AlgJ SGNH hydrolase-like domain-containing protein n=1 Tax=Dysosmobacter acutus TaxID=2841504 RepID=A0ABS6F9K8_9FIRM|nr:DHHW family protein [Dysosmobacter acutus]MBU5626050.1 hypothetical protein [Dysosmobacter acutus]